MKRQKLPLELPNLMIVRCEGAGIMEGDAGVGEPEIWSRVKGVALEEGGNARTSLPRDARRVQGRAGAVMFGGKM